MSQSSRPPSASNDESQRSPPPTPGTRSTTGVTLPHAPQTPSRLRQSFAPGSPSPEQLTAAILQGRTPETGHDGDIDEPIDFEEDGIHPFKHKSATTAASPESTRVRGQIIEDHDHSAVTENSRLLENYNQASTNYEHGTFPATPPSIHSDEYRVLQRQASNLSADDEHSNKLIARIRPYLVHVESWMSTGGYDSSQNGTSSGKPGSASQILRSWRTYLPYYVPIFKWAPQYRLAWFTGDLTAALTMASFYIPMALSYADNLAHVPPINGLYSFVINPLIYSIFGTCPQMVVGPEAPGSLLLGSVVRGSVEKGISGEDEDLVHARIAGIVTSIAGLTILLSGLFRLGFLDNVLSRSFLRGFISAIGVVIFIDQLIPELGLQGLAKEMQIDHAPALQKLFFLFGNLHQAHFLNSLVSISAFLIIMICRTAKLKAQPRYPYAAYIPDRFVVVILSAILTYAFRWDKQGLDILGEVKASGGSPFQIHWPFDLDHITHFREALSTAFLIALLGFFESSVAAKALRDGESSDPTKSIQGMSLSPNRELVAMGIANFTGGCFMALPAFGGYGRSKVNRSTGGTTPMSSIILSMITLISALYLVPYFYYLPRGVLSAMISVVAFSLVEEAPHDIRFFIRVKGWSELALMVIIFSATIVYSLTLGIALGIGLSLLRVIKHATTPRIQLLVKVPGTENQFENAEYLAMGGLSSRSGQHTSTTYENEDYSSNALIIKIPEPLTFANTGDLHSRLRRLELYGSATVHPALPRTRAEWQNQNIIFDVHGTTSIDASGAQNLLEIVTGYVDRGSKVFFCRVAGGPTGKVMTALERSGIVETCGGGNAFARSVEEALKLAAAAENSSASNQAQEV